MVETGDLFVKVGRFPKLVKEPKVAHELAIKTNELIDKKFINEPFGTGKRSQFAKQQSTDLAVAEASDKVAVEQALTIDEKTGLGSYYKFKHDLESQLKEAITQSEEKIYTADAEKLRNLHVLRLDIGLLSYANSLSGFHKTGDAYKKKVAEITGGNTREMQDFIKQHNVRFEGYATTTGDEFGIIAHGEKDVINLLMEKIQSEVAKLEIGPKSVLPASVSVGEIQGDEFFDAYKDFYLENNLLPADFYSKYFYLLNSIADFRATRNKVYGRLNLMKDLLQKKRGNKLSNPDYARLRFHTARGALEISNRELNSLVDSTDFDGSVRTWMRRIFRNRNLGGLKNATKPLDKLILRIQGELIDKMI